MSNVPTLDEELNRKSFETIRKIHDDFALGKITKQQYKYGIDIAWSIVAGLVEADIVRMFELLDKDSSSISFSERIAFRSKDGKNAVIIDSKRGFVVLKLIATGAENVMKAYDFREEPNPYLCGKNKVEALIQNLEKSGFERL
jgi:hypothetical protein